MCRARLKFVEGPSDFSRIVVAAPAAMAAACTPTNVVLYGAHISHPCNAVAIAMTFKQALCTREGLLRPDAPQNMSAFGFYPRPNPTSVSRKILGVSNCFYYHCFSGCGGASPWPSRLGTQRLCHPGPTTYAIVLGLCATWPWPPCSGAATRPGASK